MSSFKFSFLIIVKYKQQVIHFCAEHSSHSNRVHHRLWQADLLFYSSGVGDPTFIRHRDRDNGSEVFPMFAGCRLLFRLSRMRDGRRWRPLSSVFCPVVYRLWASLSLKGCPLFHDV